MLLEQFQCVVGRSDPRSVLVFSSPYVDVFPHIVHLAGELQCRLMEVPRDGVLDDVFDKALDEGCWLVVKDLQAASFDEWRRVGVRLVTLLPSATFHLRRHFRLFTFAQCERTNLRLYAPQVFCQFAISVSSTGQLIRRGDLSSIFDSSATCDIDEHSLNEVLTGGGVSKSQPYEHQSAIRQRVAAALSTKVPATHIDYIDETLCALREELEERQKQLTANLDVHIEEEMISPQNDFVEVAQNSSRQEARAHEAKKRVLQEREQDYDWIFPRIVEWAVAQCPDIDVVGTTDIPPSELSFEETIWVTPSHKLLAGSWNGCEVLVKQTQETFSSDFAKQLKCLFQREAARHFPLRHPRVVTMLGVSGDAIVFESVVGTFEQNLCRRRADGKRFTVRELLIVGKQIVEGLCFLTSKNVVHRDIACRSIFEVRKGVFKIGQFQSAFVKSSLEARDAPIPIRWTAPEALVGNFSEKSDVWSFGVLVWEALNYCSLLPFDDCLQAAEEISKGRALQKPTSCPSQLWRELVSPCFCLDPDQRPRPSQLLAKFERALNKWDNDLLEFSVPVPEDKEIVSL